MGHTQKYKNIIQIYRQTDVHGRMKMYSTKRQTDRQTQKYEKTQYKKDRQTQKYEKTKIYNLQKEIQKHIVQ